MIRWNLVPLLPNFRLSLLLLFATVHCHSSQFEDGPADSGDQARFFSLSTGSRIYGELLISLPLSIFLPSLVMRRTAMTSRADDVESTLKNVTTTTTLDRIFSTLGIGEIGCQKRFVCETMREPKKFEPISNIIYLLLRDSSPGDDGERRNKYSLDNFIHYREAFVAGQLGTSDSPLTTTTTTTTTSCIAMFPNCSVEGSATQSIDYPILKYWQKLADLVPLTITV